MIIIMKTFLKQLFCKHNYQKIDWYEEYDEQRNERYAVRIYQCSKCSKKILIDARYNFYI